MIPFRCNHCDKDLKVKDELAGKQVKCPGCGKAVLVPQLTVSLSPPPSGREGSTLPPKPPGVGEAVASRKAAPPDASGHTASGDDRTVVVDEDSRRRFEAGWRAGTPEAIEKCLPDQNAPCYLATLEELVQIEMEFQWKAWSDSESEKKLAVAKVEDYLARFPHLNQPKIVQRLVEHEYGLRQRYGSRPSIEDYEKRFPGIRLGDVDTGPDVTSFLAPPERPDEIGRLGPFRVLKILGSGGMGVVYKAEDPQLERLVALKAMLPSLGGGEAARRRFLREAKSAATIVHDHIVPILQVGEDRGVPFIAMQFLEGEPLDERLKREGRLPLPEVLRIGRETAEGMAAAHKRGLIHRDIKPANLWLECQQGEPGASATGGRVKILDFGLARAAQDDAHLTQSGAIVGTPAYMAPEQAAGEPVDHRCDLFSLGCVLYRMCTGEMPFKGRNTMAIISALALVQPAPPCDLHDDIPPPLSDLVMQLLAKKPEDRPESAQAVAQALTEIEKSFSAEPKATGHATQKVKAAGKTMTQAASTQVVGSVRKRRPLPWLAAAGIVLLAALALFYFTSRQRERPENDSLSPTFTNSLGMEFVLVPKGKSWLGGGGGTPGNKEVEVLNDFYLGKYEVTQEEWEKVTGSNPSHFAKVPGIPKENLPRLPVEGVSWDDVQLFLRRLNVRDQEAGWVYRLPNEAEWEYACRNGPLRDRFESAFDFYFAKPSNQLSDQANWDNKLKQPSMVGSYSANGLGLYDMHGNVWEWCDDTAEAGGEKSKRIVRGGAWTDNRCEASARFAFPASEPNYHVGFRLARVPVGKEIVKIIAPEEKKPAVEAKLSPTFKNSLGMEFVLVPKGKSWLGGGDGQPGTTEVEVLNDFYLGKYEVTQEEWEKVTGSNPSWFTRTGAAKDEVKDISADELKRFPVENVSWDDAQQFLSRLNSRGKESGWVYRLPREAEWEYACRGGPLADKLDSAFDYYFDKPTNLLFPGQANFKHDKSPKRTCKVGSYKPNQLGLFDMHGNVWEWCDDSEIAAAGSTRVDRSGSWDHTARSCVAASRFAQHPPSIRVGHLGLRLARVPVGKEVVKIIASAEKKPAVVAKLPPAFKNTLGMEFVLVPKGKSWLGGGDGKPGDKEVEILHNFYLGKYEVTQEEWEKLMGSTPSQFKNVAGVSMEDQKRFPVESVSWEDCQFFVKRLNKQVKDSGWVYRLPREAEWEYACRGGPLLDKFDSTFYFYFEEPSNMLLLDQANFEHGNGLKRTTKVGSYPPNKLGLHDMHGNVWEWCADEVKGDEGALQRVHRGGGWADTYGACRAAGRGTLMARAGYHNLGLRLARVPVGKEIVRIIAPDKK